jgi:hypothetical protein
MPSEGRWVGRTGPKLTKEVRTAAAKARGRWYDNPFGMTAMPRSATLSSTTGQSAAYSAMPNEIAELAFDVVEMCLHHRNVQMITDSAFNGQRRRHKPASVLARLSAP